MVDKSWSKDEVEERRKDAYTTPPRENEYNRRESERWQKYEAMQK